MSRCRLRDKHRISKAVRLLPASGHVNALPAETDFETILVLLLFNGRSNLTVARSVCFRINVYRILHDIAPECLYRADRVVFELCTFQGGSMGRSDD